MALSTASRNSVNALLSLLTAKDPAVCAAVSDAARRLLDSTHRTQVEAIVPVDGWSATPKATETTALATLITEIASV